MSRKQYQKEDQYIRQNIQWFSKLSPSQKITAVERQKRVVRYLRALEASERRT